MSVLQANPAQDAGYLQTLRRGIALYQALAEVRSERNDVHDAKMRAWDETRPKLTSNAEFEAMWRQARPAGKDEEIARCERELMNELAKVHTVLEHLKYAGLAPMDERS
jgi:hypothetical protein